MITKKVFQGGDGDDDDPGQGKAKGKVGKSRKENGAIVAKSSANNDEVIIVTLAEYHLAQEQCSCSKNKQFSTAVICRRHCFASYIGYIIIIMIIV